MDILEDVPEEKRQDLDQAFEKQDHIESLQILGDLQYLPLKAFEDQSISKEELKSALAKFRLDCSEALADKEASNFHAIYQESMAFDGTDDDSATLSERDTFLLENLVGLEKELLIHVIPENRTSLLSRVLIYRYRVYDLIRLSANAKMNAQNIQTIATVVEDMKYEGDWIAFSNVLADQAALSEFCIDSARLNSLLYDTTIFFSIKKKTGKHFWKEYKSSIKNINAFLNGIANGSARTTIEKLLTFPDKSEVKADIALKIGVAENQFLLRVLQVKLWILGLYDGKLDHDFGPVTFKALDEYIDLIEEQHGDPEARSKIIYLINREQCALNFEHILKYYIHPLEVANTEEESSVSQVYEYVLKEDQDYGVTDLSSNDRQLIAKRQTELNQSLEDELANHSKDIVAGKEQKRRYQGRKGILRIFSKLVKWAKNAVKSIVKLFKKLIGIIKKAVKVLFNEIKEGVKTFRRGFSFLFGKRVINTENQVITDFDFDFDGHTIFKRDATNEAITLHQETVQSYVASISPTLKFTKMVIQWGIRLGTGPVGWVKILIGVAKLLKEYLIEKLKEKKAQLT